MRLRNRERDKREREIRHRNRERDKRERARNELGPVGAQAWMARRRRRGGNVNGSTDERRADKPSPGSGGLGE